MEENTAICVRKLTYMTVFFERLIFNPFLVFGMKMVYLLS